MKQNLSHRLNSRFLISLVTLVALVFGSFNLEASDTEGHGEKKAFNMSEMIMHHVSDGHSVHIWGDVYLPLPVILYNKNSGLEFFMSNNLYDVEHGHQVNKPYTASSGVTYMNSHGIGVQGEDPHHSSVIDFSITKSLLGMFIALFLVLLIFTTAAKGYAKREGKAPKGIQNVVEPFVIFLRDELIIPSVGKKHAARFTPFLLTIFFFIWTANMLGLVPFLGGFNVTGTLSITLVLAGMVFIITTVNGNKHYWGHILWPPGVPLPIKLILVPIEVLSIFIKPAVLMVRLTANITAGHIIILSFVGLILMVGQNSFGGGIAVAVGSVAFMIFMFFIELLVAFIQAYVFTLLTALYFGEATQEAHH
ncbi:MAG: F-type H+-transporting ATPase subunit a [Patiriisocius sp.]|jgi:F-type H+-transporting ATPase subunit a